MGTAVERSSPEIDRLKDLLFKAEAARLQALQDTVDALGERVGSAVHLEIATAEILVDAFRRAEIERPRELAAAVAPSVVAAIRNEVRNSREAMVEALYPIIGRLVLAAVADAVKQLVITLQQQIDAQMSADQWRWRLKSWLTRRPISEIAVAESGRIAIRRLLLIERGSGRLRASWTAPDTVDDNPDLVSGMLAAITDFSAQALPGSGNLRMLDFGGREILLRASPTTIFAAEYQGTLRPEDHARIDAAFMDLVEVVDKGEVGTEQALLEIAGTMQSPESPAKPPSRTSRMVLSAIAAIVLALIAWKAVGAVLNWRFERQVAAAVDTGVKAQPALQPFPFHLAFDHAKRVVTVDGLVATSDNVAPFEAALAQAIAPYRFENHIVTLSSREQLTRLQTAVAEQSASDAKAQQAIAAKQAAQDTQIDALRKATVAPDTRLEKFIADTAIFFGNGNAYLDPAEATNAIKQLADLLAGGTQRIRVVGYSDGSGGTEANRILARKRAELVERDLVAQGVAADRLVIVSRSSAMPITDTVGGTTPGNRRVIFEKLYNSE